MKLPTARQRASAVIVVLAILGILSLYVLVNVRTLTRLKHDVQQIEQRQLQRLQATRVEIRSAKSEGQRPYPINGGAARIDRFPSVAGYPFPSSNFGLLSDFGASDFGLPAPQFTRCDRDGRARNAASAVSGY